MPAPLLILAPLLVLLLLAAAWDIASYTIPNFIPAVLLVGFLVFAAMTGYTAAAFGWHLLASGIGLAAGFALFAFGCIGGGDAKLFACVAAWFGLHDLLQYVLVASLFGGALTVLLLTARRWPLPAPLAGQAWIARLHEPRAGIPYGVALSAGAIAILPYTELFRSVTG
jgi:prepilin peptidase CpaA